MRKKSSIAHPLRSWDEVAENLRAIGQIRANRAQAVASAGESMAEIKEALARDIRGYDAAVEQLIEEAEAFCVEHRVEFGEAQSRQLAHGVVGWRKSTSISVGKKTLELINEVFGAVKSKVYLHIKESPDKEALAKLTDEQLKEIGARRSVKEEFYAEPATAKIGN